MNRQKRISAEHKARPTAEFLYETFLKRQDRQVEKARQRERWRLEQRQKRRRGKL